MIWHVIKNVCLYVIHRHGIVSSVYRMSCIEDDPSSFAISSPVILMGKTSKLMIFKFFNK